jgi:hypothetical protein
VNIAGFEFTISEITESPADNLHPFQTIATFVFADDKPNGNNQLLPYEEFENVKRTAIGMPVKIKFSGIDAENHVGSVPIGVITGMSEDMLPDGTRRLIAKATFWTEEYPEEVAYIKDSFANKKAPGLSWELGYKESIAEGLIQRLKDVVALAATFVKKPAYGSRTHLLAISSLEEGERNKEILALADTIKSDEPKPKGGIHSMDEKEIEALKTASASKDVRITELETKLSEAETEKTALAEENKSLKLASVIESRTRRYVEAGFQMEAEDAGEARKTLFGSLSDTQFDAYLNDLAAAKKVAPKGGLPVRAQASQNQELPRIDFNEETLTSLKDGMRNLARPHSA